MFSTVQIYIFKWLTEKPNIFKLYTCFVFFLFMKNGFTIIVLVGRL